MEYRGYKIEREPVFLMIEINAIGRGSVHKSLRGFYQTTKDAMKAVDVYEAGKEESNGKTITGSGNQPIRRRFNYRREPINNS